MIEKGNPETADHRPVTGRPGVQAENTEQKRRTAHLSYSGRFFQSCVNPVLAAVRIRTGCVKVLAYASSHRLRHSPSFPETDR